MFVLFISKSDRNSSPFGFYLRNPKIPISLAASLRRFEFCGCVGSSHSAEVDTAGYGFNLSSVFETESLTQTHRACGGVPTLLFNLKKSTMEQARVLKAL